MTLGLEMLGAFLAGIAFEIAIVLIFGKRIINWAMRGMLARTMVAQGKTSDGKTVSVHRVES